MEMHSNTVFHLTSQLQLDAVMAFSYPLNGWAQEDVTIQDEMIIEDLDLIFDDCFCDGDYTGFFNKEQGPVVEALALFLAKQVPDESFTCDSYYDNFSDGSMLVYDISYTDRILSIGEKTNGSYFIPENTKVMFDDPSKFAFLFKGIPMIDDLITQVTPVKSLDDDPEFYVCHGCRVDSEESRAAIKKGVQVMIEQEFIRSLGDESEFEEAGIDEDEIEDIFRWNTIEDKPFIYRYIVV